MAFGRYELLDLVHEGHLSESFRARPVEGGEDDVVILRRILPSLLENHRVVELFRDEAKVTTRLDHANLVRVLDTGEVDGWPYFITEFIDGITCSKLVERCAKSGTELSLSECAYVTSRVLLGLEHIHRAIDENGDLVGLVHGEVGAERVILGRNGAIRLDALGAGSQQHHNLRASVAKGKAQTIRLAPEQILGRSFDHRIDVFNAGVLLAELLIQRPLFATGNQLSTLMSIRDVQLDALDESPRRLPPKLEKVLRRALAKEPDGRHRSASELARELSGFFGVLTGEELESGLGEIVTEAMAMEVTPTPLPLQKQEQERRKQGGSTPSWYPTANQHLPRVDSGEQEVAVETSKERRDRAEEAPNEEKADVHEKPTVAPERVQGLVLDGWTVTPTPAPTTPKDAPERRGVGRETLRSTAPPPAAGPIYVPSESISPGEKRAFEAPTPSPEGRVTRPSEAPTPVPERKASRPSAAPTPMPSSPVAGHSEEAAVLEDDAQRNPPASDNFSQLELEVDAVEEDELESDGELELELDGDFWGEEHSAVDAVPDADDIDDDEEENLDAGLTTQTLVIASVMFRTADGASHGPFNFPAALDKVYGGEFQQTDEASIDGKPFRQLKELSEFAVFAEEKSDDSTEPFDDHRPSRPFDEPMRPSRVPSGAPAGSAQPEPMSEESEAHPVRRSSRPSRRPSKAARRKSHQPQEVRRPSWPTGEPANISTSSQVPQRTPRPSDPPRRFNTDSETPRASSWDPPFSEKDSQETFHPNRRTSDPPIILGESDSVEVDLEDFVEEEPKRKSRPEDENRVLRQGWLDVEPASRVLYDIFLKKETRCVVFEHGPIRKELEIREGVPVDVMSNIASESFSEYLVRAGHLSQMELEMALAMRSKFNNDLGDSLIGLGLCDEAELVRHLRAHLSSTIKELISWSKGEFRIFSQSSSDHGFTPNDLDVVLLLWEGHEDLLEPSDIDRWFDDHKNDVVIPQEDLKPLYSRADLPTPVRRLYRALKSPKPISQLVEAHGGQHINDKRKTTLGIRLADELALIDLKAQGQ